MKQQTAIDRKAARLIVQLDALTRRVILKEKLILEDDVSLTRQEFRLVLTLGKKQPCAMGELANDMMLAVSSLTPLADRLVVKRLIRREHAEGDRRVVFTSNAGGTACGWRGSCWKRLTSGSRMRSSG